MCQQYASILLNKPVSEQFAGNIWKISAKLYNGWNGNRNECRRSWYSSNWKELLLGLCFDINSIGLLINETE